VDSLLGEAWLAAVQETGFGARSVLPGADAGAGVTDTVPARRATLRVERRLRNRRCPPRPTAGSEASEWFGLGLGLHPWYRVSLRPLQGAETGSTL